MRAAALFAVVAVETTTAAVARTAPAGIDVSAMPRIATVDDRFASYNVELASAVGGTFWKPYGSEDARHVREATADRSGKRALRRMAAALGPAFVRVSGTWANSVYFHDAEAPPPAAPPPRFQSILTRRQWAAELFNEPTFAAMGGAPPGYDAADDARDFVVFRRFVRATTASLTTRRSSRARVTGRRSFADSSWARASSTRGRHRRTFTCTYAHCLRGGHGGVALLAINLRGERVAPGRKALAPESTSLFAIVDAQNPDCP